MNVWFVLLFPVACYLVGMISGWLLRRAAEKSSWEGKLHWW